jgi:hypothetical protein
VYRGRKLARFKQALTGALETGTNTVKITGFNVETIKWMVEFLYTKVYGNPTEERGSEGIYRSGTTICEGVTRILFNYPVPMLQDKRTEEEETEGEALGLST